MPSYIRFRAKRFTRKRYAFAFLASSTALFVTVVTTLLAKPPWIALADLFHHWLPNIWLPNIIPQPAQANWSERIFVILGFIAVVWLQYRVLQHWSGGRSVHQVEAERNKEQLSVLDEGITEGRRWIRREPPPKVFDGTLDREFDTISVSDRELAEAYHLNRHTVAKWRQRRGVEDASHRPQRSTPRPRKRWWQRCVRPSCYPWMTCWR